MQTNEEGRRAQEEQEWDQLFELVERSATKNIKDSPFWRLDLSDRDLTLLPRSIGRLCGHVVELDLSFNRLVEIPSEIGLLTSLRSLNLQHNKLISVPKELFLLKGLTDLLLDSNQLLFLPAEALSKVASYNLFRAQNNPFPAIRALTGEVGSPHHDSSSSSSSSSRSDNNNNDGEEEEEEERGGKKVKEEEEEEEQAVEEPHWWKYEIEKGKPPPWAPLPSLLMLCAQNVFRHYSLKQAKVCSPFLFYFPSCLFSSLLFSSLLFSSLLFSSFSLLTLSFPLLHGKTEARTSRSDRMGTTRVLALRGLPSPLHRAATPPHRQGHQLGRRQCDLADCPASLL
ncbi:C-terminal of Roc, COR, domain [Balamuthia mandrillaris]